MKLEILPETIKDIFTLANFDFELTELDTKNQRSITNPTEKVKISYNGTSFTANLESKSFFNTIEKKFDFITFQFVLNTNETKEIAQMYLRLKLGVDKLYEVHTDVINHYRGIGLGRFLWESSLPIIQKLSNKLQEPVTHIVKRYPKENLTAKKWNELFFPLLEKYNYEENGSSSWKKIYTPKISKIESI